MRANRHVIRAKINIASSSAVLKAEKKLIQDFFCFSRIRCRLKHCELRSKSLVIPVVNYRMFLAVVSLLRLLLWLVPGGIPAQSGHAARPARSPAGAGACILRLRRPTTLLREGAPLGCGMAGRSPVRVFRRSLNAWFLKSFRNHRGSRRWDGGCALAAGGRAQTMAM